MSDREKIEAFLDHTVDFHDEVAIDATLDKLEAMVRAMLEITAAQKRASHWGAQHLAGMGEAIERRLAEVLR